MTQQANDGRVQVEQARPDMYSGPAWLEDQAAVTNAPEAPEAPEALAADPHAVMLRGTLLALVRRDGRDLSSRQLTAFLIVYMDETRHTVSSLAEVLQISRPAVTRLMDRLVEFDLVAREDDHDDRRRVLARRTAQGAAFFRELTAIARAAGTPGTLPARREAKTRTRAGA